MSPGSCLFRPDGVFRTIVLKPWGCVGHRLWSWLSRSWKPAESRNTTNHVLFLSIIIRWKVDQAQHAFCWSVQSFALGTLIETWSTIQACDTHTTPEFSSIPEHQAKYQLETQANSYHRVIYCQRRWNIIDTFVSQVTSFFRHSIAVSMPPMWLLVLFPSFWHVDDQHFQKHISCMSR